ncbi:MAG TPA: hypothetical protein VEC56_01975 [Candidatus Krumholzibacteria bacterium]|nr:hypothetical protein [Candidatus Krumholzibacteria bacterium]
MTRFLQRLIAGARQAHSTELGSKGCVALAVLLASCGTVPPARQEGQIAASPPRYSLVFIIHGDGDYLYHDALGNARRADEDVLSRAQAIAERNPNAEVFIFHQIERRHVLFLIPRRDGRAYYYRHGHLREQKAYWRDQGDSRFDPEVRLYEQFAGTQPLPPVRLFFYFGHELPELNGAGYDASYSERRVSIHDLAEGVRAIAGESAKIDLLALATCFGGTPYTVGALAPHARYIVASPDNLHLSYFDLEPLAGLDFGSSDGDITAFANRFARNAFEQLARDVETVVSVVVYDVDAVSGFVDSVADAYARTVTAADGTIPAPIERCDCADEVTYTSPGMNDGLTVFYRAPRFGRMKNEPRHSGWECWRATK